MRAAILLLILICLAMGFYGVEKQLLRIAIAIENLRERSEPPKSHN